MASAPGCLVIISGPTAVGKTGVALELARRLEAEIVNADSLQVYRGLDIGTAKPTVAERRAVPHHLVDIIDPDEPYNAARYVADADRAIERIQAAGRLPLVVGGTGFYLRALIYGLCELSPVPPAVRCGVREMLEQDGPEALHRELAAVDPVMAARLEPRDRSRLVRALEVFRATGRSIADFQREHRFTVLRRRVLHLCLVRERGELYARIAERTAAMLAAGLVEEMRGLLGRGFAPTLKPLRSIGYRQAGEFLAGRQRRETLAEEIGRETRRYAKRQLTWFRHAGDAELLLPAAWDGIGARIEAFMARPD
ncbi:MAG: tRNA (adenosine(37)-N6)-dimethylallyltransferase MiaA [Deltaproteobacteria bacterium]|nr:tRNA (adenosine(37)-N6)-dimethylallyltransferase MiaA [Candidatus Anaeroferrophillacea bacterium]